MKHRRSSDALPGLWAQRLYDEVRAAGYPGGYGCVWDYVRAVRPREVPERVVRFETPAGHQGQLDFAMFTLPWGRRHALVVVLSHSWLLWVCTGFTTWRTTTGRSGSSWGTATLAARRITTVRRFRGAPATAVGTGRERLARVFRERTASRPVEYFEHEEIATIRVQVEVSPLVASPGRLYRQPPEH